jgi:hypothetical protein
LETGISERGSLKGPDCYGVPYFSPLADGLARMITDTAYDSGKGNASAQKLSGRLKIPFGDSNGNCTNVNMNGTGSGTPRSPVLNAEVLESSQFLLIHWVLASQSKAGDFGKEGEPLTEVSSPYRSLYKSISSH